MHRRRLVLLGAGHAHLHVLRHAGRLLRAGHTVTLVAPPLFWYSGMVTGMLGGTYATEDDQVDVAAVARDAGCTHLADLATGLDRSTRVVRLASGGSLPFDVLSVAIGSEAAVLPGEAPFAAKPIHRLWELRQQLEAACTDAPPRILVAGGGITACELAVNIAALCRRHGGGAEITVLAPPDGLLTALHPRAKRTVLRVLRRAGIAVRQDGPVLGLAEGSASLPGGTVAFDLAINATGLRPPSVLRQFGLPLDQEGGLLVDRHLRSTGDPAVHGAGDCIAFGETGLPRAGVFAVRQGPVLLDNLQAALENTAPRPFVPQRRFLWIMNLGDGTGLATYGRWWWHGRAAFWLKDWIDRRFMAASRRVTPARP